MEQTKKQTKKQVIDKERPVYIPLAERFHTLPDVVMDKYTTRTIGKRLDAITKGRKKKLQEIVTQYIKDSKPGHELNTPDIRLKRNQYDTLRTAGNWRTAYFQSEFLIIAQKESKQPGTIRHYIEIIVTEAMNDTMKFYRALEERGAKNA